METEIKNVETYYHFIRQCGERLQAGAEKSPYPHIPGYYLEDINFFIGITRISLRINHLKNLKRLHKSSTMELRPSHKGWLSRMSKLAKKHMEVYTQKDISNSGKFETAIL